MYVLRQRRYRALLQIKRAILWWCRARLWWHWALLQWYRTLLHEHSLSRHTSSSICVPRLFCSDVGSFAVMSTPLWYRALLRWCRALLHEQSLSHNFLSSCTPRLACSDIEFVCSDAGLFWISARYCSAARQHYILCTYMYLCLYIYNTFSFICWTSMYLMCNTLLCNILHQVSCIS